MLRLLFILTTVYCANEIKWPVDNRILQLKPGASKSDSPPSYMIHLYNRYRKGRMPYSSANTVRSFFPTQARLGNDDILVFNLTGIHPSEYVEKVDLHLQSKGVRSSSFKYKSSRLEQKRSQVEVDVFDLSQRLRPKIETIPLSKAQSSGWQTLDITDSIIACLEGEAEQHHLVGVAIRGPMNTDVGDVISQPFIVIFSEDQDHLGIEELDRDVKFLRRKREILNNELPDYPAEKLDGSLAEARLKYQALDSSVVPLPEARKVSKSEMEKHRKRRRRKRRKDKRLPYAWGKSWWQKTDSKNNPDYEGDEEDDVGDDDVLEDEPDVQMMCQKRKMVVSFADIGWGDRIISPKSFDASYCSGVCPQVPKKATQQTNHATIQNLVHSLGIQKGVPDLCCVPNSLSPVSLLYYDRNRNVVLKSYPDMSVQSCTCR